MARDQGTGEHSSDPASPKRHLTDAPPQVLIEPYTYLAAVPGKEVRSALIEAFNLWMHVAEADIAVVKKVVGMLHTASLLCVLPPMPVLPGEGH